VTVTSDAPAASAAGQAALAALDLVLADPRRASAEATRALGLARRERDPAARSVAYRALGLSAHGLNDLGAALAAMNTAVRVADAAGLAAQAAQARMSRAFILQARGRMQAALRDADAAISGMQGLDRARARAHQALILQRAGELDRALAVYGAALPALRRHGDRAWEARLRNNRAILHAFQGHLGRARADITQTAQLWTELEKPQALATTQVNLAVIEGMHGNIPAALAAFDRATDEFGKNGWPLAPIMMEKAEVLLSAGLAGDALTAVSTAVAELARDRNGADLGEARLLMARCQLAAGLPAAASESAAAARRGFTRQHRPGWAAVARYVEAHAAWAAGEPSPELLRSTRKAATELDAVNWPTAALDPRLLAAQVAMKLGRLEVARAELRMAARARNSAQLEQRARAWHALALLRLQAGDRRGAYAAVSAGLTAAERVRLLLGATELRVMVASHVADLAALGVQLAVEQRSAARVLWSAERYRAATLRIRPVLPPADEKLATLRTQLRAVSGEAERARLAGMPLQAFNRRQHALEDQLRQRLWQHDGVAGGQAAAAGPVPGGTAPALARELARALGDMAGGPRPAGQFPDRVPLAALVEYIESDGLLYAVVVTGGAGDAAGRRARGRSSLHALGPVAPLREKLGALSFACRRLLTGHGSAVSLESARRLAGDTSRDLAEALLAPLAAVGGAGALVIVPSGSLQSLPWPLLPGCAGRPVAIAPSAASWLAARPQAAARPRAPGGGRVVLVAGPGVPQAEAEVAALAAAYPGAQVLTGAQATEAATLRALDGADIAHIAAHGTFRADNPMFSSIALADGQLTVYDIERLGHAPKTIMLAACDTAMSSSHPGDEVTGLASALLAVGAGSVVAPLLPLPDELAGQLAGEWHQRLRAGSPPAAALAGASAAVAAGGPLARLAGAVTVCVGHGG
jgi:tetratricopeptide (TPR) repeat protein